LGWAAPLRTSINLIDRTKSSPIRFILSRENTIFGRNLVPDFAFFRSRGTRRALIGLSRPLLVDFFGFHYFSVNSDATSAAQQPPCSRTP
jgi:hypothetical protein